MKRMRQDEDKTGMDKIKENEAAYNLKEYDSDKSNEEDVSRTVQADLSDAGEQDVTPENTEKQPVTYKEYSTEYLVSAVEAILFSIGESVSVDRLAKALEMEIKKLSKQMEEVLTNLQSVRSWHQDGRT